jgi:hypothetical protein
VEAQSATAGFFRAVIASQSGAGEAIGIRFWLQDARPLVSRHELDGDRSQPGQAVLGICAPRRRANQPQRTPLRAQHNIYTMSDFIKKSDVARIDYSNIRKTWGPGPEDVGITGRKRISKRARGREINGILETQRDKIFTSPYAK